MDTLISHIKGKITINWKIVFDFFILRVSTVKKTPMKNPSPCTVP